MRELHESVKPQLIEYEMHNSSFHEIQTLELVYKWVSFTFNCIKYEIVFCVWVCVFVDHSHKEGIVLIGHRVGDEGYIYKWSINYLFIYKA